MSRFALLAGASALAGFTALVGFSPASAQQEVYFSFDDSDSKAEKPAADQRYVVCTTAFSDKQLGLITDVIVTRASDIPRSAVDLSDLFIEDLGSREAIPKGTRGYCNIFNTRASAEEDLKFQSGRYDTYGWRVKTVAFNIRPAATSSPTIQSTSEPQPSDSNVTRVTISGSDASAPQESWSEQVAKRRAEREAEFQKKQAAYEAALADQQKQVADFEQARADVAAKKEQQRKQVEAARAEFARQQEEHRREVERLAQQGFAEQARYALCLGGDQKACADMEAGVPVNVEVAEAKAPEASTDDDATICVSRPVVTRDQVFKGQTDATVFNGCLKPVDIRICLLRTGGWNCGVGWSIKPQEKFSYGSFEATGEIFWDAKIRGTNRSLRMPQ